MFSVIFDMDGTLLDTQSISIPAWNYAGSLQGIENAGAHIEKVCGMNEAGWSSYLTEQFKNMDIVAFKKAAWQYIGENLVIKYKGGIKELLDFLKDNNIKIALASGTERKKVLYSLGKVGATDYFSAIVGGDEVENGKPAPDVFLKAASLLNADPKDCIVFEDSKNGILAAKAAGMRVIGIPDVARFDAETKKLLLAELSSADKAMEILKKLI